MCGVFGWIKFGHSLTEKEIALALKATQALSHRGPDFQGQWYDDNVYMAHRRLSIIDLSREANQPFIDQNQGLIISFNGEIYNYLELKEELKKQGILFKTASDTEVFLKSFGIWRQASFLKFDGMFAGAIHDGKRREHYLFRDYLGQKPLYYYIDDNQLIYSSEIRSLLDLDGFHWRLHKDNFLKFLANSYYAWDTSPVEGIKKLLPGCYLTVNVRDGGICLKRFWDSLPNDGAAKITLSEAISEFRRIFERSCEISMRSDVPYGVFLSGGIDSSLVLESCKKFNQSVASFNVAMGEADFDESAKAAAVTKHLEITRKNTYNLDSNTIQDSIDAFFIFSDEPHGDPGFVNSYFLAKSCKSEITVALSGDGSDELFAGYMPFLALGKERLFRSIPPFISGMFKFITHHVLPGGDTYLDFKFKCLSFLEGFPAHETVRFPLWLSAISPEELRLLCPWRSQEFFSRVGEKGTLFEEFRDVLSVMEGKSRFKMLIYFYQKFFLPEFVCMHTDRASMQNSLEVRSPFLSAPLIKFANALPDEIKVSRGELKLLLRNVAKEDGFPELIYKQKKQGFTFPLARWLKVALRQKMDNLLSKERYDTGLIDYTYVDFLKKEHLSDRRNNYRVLFNLMVFNKWIEKYPHVSI